MSIVFFVSLTWLPQRGVHYTVKYKPWNINILFISYYWDSISFKFLLC